MNIHGCDPLVSMNLHGCDPCVSTYETTSIHECPCMDGQVSMNVHRWSAH